MTAPEHSLAAGPAMVTTRVMPAETGIAIVETKLADFNAEAKAVLKATICPGYSDEELRLFAAYCARTKLDPFSRQIVTWKQGGKVVIHTGIDGFRVIAERSGQYDGQEITLESEPSSDGKGKVLVSAACKVYRKGMSHPIAATAYWSEYAPKEIKPDSSWDRMPTVMLSKCAEALALRKAFPNDLSGVYEPAEVEG